MKTHLGGVKRVQPTLVEEAVVAELLRVIRTSLAVLEAPVS